MTLKKAVVVIALVLGGAVGRTAAFAVNGNDEGSCWQEYVATVVQSATDFESCLQDLMLFGSLGAEWCAFLYVEQTEWALARFVGCLLGVAG